MTIFFNETAASGWGSRWDPLLVFSFSFQCDPSLFDDHGACSANMWQPLANGWALAVCVQCVWCMRGKKGACKTSNHPFNFWMLSVTVCVCGGRKWEVCVVYTNVEGLIKDLRQPGHPVLQPIVHLSSLTLDHHSSCSWVHVFDYSRRDRNTNEQHYYGGWSILGFPVPFVSDLMNRKNRGLAMLCNVFVPIMWRFFW